MNNLVPEPVVHSPWYLENIITKQRINLNVGLTKVGRRPKSNIVLIREFISRDHCQISISPDEIKIRDLGTTNGTFVNGTARKNEEAELKVGDRIGIGCETDEPGDFPIFLLFKEEFSDPPILLTTDDSNPSNEKEKKSDNKVMITDNSNPANKKEKKSDDKVVITDNSNPAQEKEKLDDEIVVILSDDEDDSEDSLDILLRNFDSFRKKEPNDVKETENDAISENVAQKSKSADSEKNVSNQMNDKDISCHNQIKSSIRIEKSAAYNKEKIPVEKSSTGKKPNAQKSTSNISKCTKQKDATSETSLNLSDAFQNLYDQPSEVIISKSTKAVQRTTDSADSTVNVKNNISECYGKEKSSTSKEIKESMRRNEKKSSKENNTSKNDVQKNIDGNNSPSRLKSKDISGKKSNALVSDPDFHKQKKPSTSKRVEKVESNNEEKPADKKHTKKNSKRDKEKDSNGEKMHIPESKENDDATKKSSECHKKRKFTSKISEPSTSNQSKEKSRISKETNSRHEKPSTSNVPVNLNSNLNKKDDKNIHSTKVQRRKSISSRPNTADDTNESEPPIKKSKTDESDIFKNYDIQIKKPHNITNNTKVSEEPESGKLNRRNSEEKKSETKQTNEFPHPNSSRSEDHAIYKQDDAADDYDFNLSQSMIREFKQEIVDLDYEESYEANSNPSAPAEHYLYKDSKPQSPIFIDDDEDDQENENVSKWALKLSQSSSTSFDNSIDNKNKRKIPEIISAPPLKRGKLRVSSSSAKVPSPKESLKKNLERRVRHIRQNDRISDYEKECKKKWLQKPNIEKQKERESQRKIQEERKQKLKELAKSQANRKNTENDNDDVRIVNKPKAKVTYQNRGAFLVEDISSSKPVKSNVNRKAISSPRQTISEPITINLIETSNTNQIVQESESITESTFVGNKISKRRVSLLNPDKLDVISNSNTERISGTEISRENVTEEMKSAKTITSHVCLLNAEIEKKVGTIQRRRRSISSRERHSSSDRQHVGTSEVINVSDKMKTMKIPKLSATKSKDEEITNNDNIANPIFVTEQNNQDQILNNENIIGESSKHTKSILNVLGAVRPKKTVRFNDHVDIRYYEIDTEQSNRTRKVDAKDISIDMSSFVDRSAKNSIVHKNTVNHTDSTLTEILSWNPNWLDTKTANVNGTGHSLLPMVHQFQSLEDFTRVIFPLMKLEVWACIEDEYSHKLSHPYFPTHINNMVVERRGYNQRFVLYADVRPPTKHQRFSPVNAGDLVITRFDIGSKTTKIFGYLSSVRKAGQEPNKTFYQVNLELNVSPTIKELIDSKQNISIKPITQIRVDLGAFNAIHHLKYSPLCKNILNPFQNLVENDLITSNIRYKGDDQLNEHQRDILLKTYIQSIDRSSAHISLIEGPPGTGKSRVISNLTLQLLYGDQVKPLDRKILLCAQSNAAIDVIAIKLIEIRKRQTHNKFNLVRFGIFDKIHPNVQCVSVQKFVENFGNQKQSPADKNILRNEKIILEGKIAALEMENFKNSVNVDELCELKKRLQIVDSLYNQQTPVEQEMNLFPKIVRGAHIVCTTLSSCIKLLQHTNYFDVCIVDEATQCLEPWTLIPLQFGISSLILVGDTQQLPATVLSQITAKFGFGISLFTRIQKCLEGAVKKPVHILRTQYRMHPDISSWPNTYFYQNLLINDLSTFNTKIPLVPYIVFNLQSSQNYNDNRGKISNTLEADFVLDLITNLTKLVPVKTYRYGVITPYAQQRDAIVKKIHDIGIKEVSINTVDSYQGKEKDIIIISNARTHGVGFLGNCQRLNVALTRARKCLILCGNFRSLESVPVWKSLLNNARERKLFYNLDETYRTDFDKKVLRFIKTSADRQLTKPN